MVRNDSRISHQGRLRLTLVAMLGFFVFLAAVLWSVQMRDASEYESHLNRQSVRRVRLPAPRGRIFDRYGRCLADNRPGYGIAIYVEELRQPGRISRTVDHVGLVVDRLAESLNLEREITEADIREHVVRKRPLPLLAWRDMGEDTLARLAESNVTFPGAQERIPGVDVTVESIRVYPEGRLAAHVIGHVGLADPDLHQEDAYHYYIPAIEGRNGVERVRNEALQGQPGGYLVRVDASGFKHRELGRRDPLPGEDVVLAIDARIQRAAESVLEGVIGAVVVLDPRNGDVLAMASGPTFDPNAFSMGIAQQEWNQLLRDENRPLVNRAASGIYPPGSVFKMVVAIAALENRRSSPDMVFDCSGVYRVGDHPFHCWRKSGHGWIDLRKALEQSCNVYFYQLGLMCGYERIYRMADALSIGRRTGLDLPGEAAGLLPDDAWKRRTLRDAWRPGDTCNVSIGQGALAVTPLQMAVMTAAIANGGRVYRPRTTLGASLNPARIIEMQSGIGMRPGEALADLRWSDETLTVVRGGMLDVVHAPDGTGQRARVEGVRMAGKTGTAQYTRDGEARRHAWMAAYAPFENPRIAAVLVVEHSPGGGGLIAAPRMQTLMTVALGMDDVPAGKTIL